MRIAAQIFQPSFTDIRVFEELGLLLLKLLDGHFLLGDQIGEFLKELLGIGFENLPRRICDDGVKPALLIYNLVELKAPVERFEGFDIRDFQCTLYRLAFGILLLVPRGLFILDAEMGKLIEQDRVQRFEWLPFSGFRSGHEVREGPRRRWWRGGRCR